MYYSEEEGEYLPCYKDCLFCFDKEQNLIDDEGNNYLNMNCLSCNKSDNFIYFTKTAKNCLNCKSQNKYVNSAKTFCIDNIPDGYYLINSETNEINITELANKVKFYEDNGKSIVLKSEHELFEAF